MKVRQFILHTPRLLLREMRPTDGSSLFEAAACPQINLMHNNEFDKMENVRRYISVLNKEYEDEKYRTLAIADSSVNKLIGLITIDVDKFFPRAEISYWIDKRYRNRGFATEAVRAIIHYGFSNLGLNRIQGMHFTNNPASGRVLEKAGMSFEGILRQYVGLNGTFHDCKMYSIIKSEFILE